ncbi:MAG TPA: PAS domain S-box protein, partial [Desulfobacteraceae bacterium]|nr:PAS domain S-box protein [Desulfobacteraceae bacterium]
VLFLYQSNRVSRLTAENLEIYARNVIESMPAGLITIDRQGRIVSCNHKAREILGRESAELEGMVLARLGRETGCDLAGLLDGEKDFLDRSLECVLPGGRSIPLKVSAAALLNRDGERVGTVLTMRDMREIRDMEEQLERSRRLAALGRMAAAIAHEIRNPLGTLRGFAQYFRQQAENSATDRENADLMVSEVDRLNRTVSGLLQFARPREPEMRQVALGRLLEKAGRLMGDDFADHGIDFRLEPPEEEIIFKADPDLMIQVLINLLQNALHATGAGGRVELSGWAEPDTIVITVHDSGRGISQEVRSRMFDPFYTTQKEGSGLGLAVVHQVIEQHHGSIMVDSVVGRGTIIRLFLPGRAGNHPPGEDNG